MKVYTYSMDAASQTNSNRELSPFFYRTKARARTNGLQTILKSLLGSILVSLVLSVLVAMSSPDLPIDQSNVQTYAQTYI